MPDEMEVDWLHQTQESGPISGPRPFPVSQHLAVFSP
jgi:hypothetical protein